MSNNAVVSSSVEEDMTFFSLPEPKKTGNPSDVCTFFFKKNRRGQEKNGIRKFFRPATVLPEAKGKRAEKV
jgi:hypothetical protein